MYKLLLCLRYLRTRWIALASIVSMTLGVATLIVVNSVMGGFATEMRDRVRGVLSDVVIKGGGYHGFPDAAWHMDQIRQALGDRVETMTPVVDTIGMLSFTVRGRTIPQYVRVIGVDPDTYRLVGKFQEYLHEPALRERPSFEIRDEVRRAMDPWHTWGGPRDSRSGRRVRQPVQLGNPEQSASPELGTLEAEPDDSASEMESSDSSDAIAIKDATGAESTAPTDGDDLKSRRDYHNNPFENGSQQRRGEAQANSLIDSEPEEAKDRGIIVPWLLATFRLHGEDREVIRLGHPVLLTLPSGSVSSMQIVGRNAQFTVVGRFKSGMSEYDQTNCYVHIRDLQEILGMDAADRVTAIEIKLKDYADAREVVRQLEEIFLPPFFTVRTWEQEQGPLLSAVAVEQGILNVLLFMIIAVAGFGILAIFFMIVVEKSRDIGILKSLGASDGGVLQIFLWYGLGLGAIGAGLGTAIGLTIVINLDAIEQWLSWASGHDVFSRDLYYFDKIPTVIDGSNIAWIVTGAMLIAVAASVLPARRAASLRPVEVLRFDNG